VCIFFLILTIYIRLLFFLHVWILKTILKLLFKFSTFIRCFYAIYTNMYVRVTLYRIIKN